MKNINKISVITLILLAFFLNFCNNSNSKNVKQECNNSSKTSSFSPQKICPVMGGEIDKSIAPVIKNGLKIYMCCEHCRNELTDSFEENVDKIKKMGQSVEKL